MLSQVERAKKRAAAQAAAEARERQSQRGWLSWAWGGGDKKDGSTESVEEDEDMRGGLNEEEQEALRALASEQEDALISGQCALFHFGWTACLHLASCKTYWYCHVH